MQKSSGVNHKIRRVVIVVAVCLFALAALAVAAQDKYTLKVPNGLAFAEFRGYEAWQVRTPGCCGPRESGDDQGLYGRHAR